MRERGAAGLARLLCDLLGRAHMNGFESLITPLVKDSGQIDRRLGSPESCGDLIWFEDIGTKELDLTDMAHRRKVACMVGTTDDGADAIAPLRQDPDNVTPKKSRRPKDSDKLTVHGLVEPHGKRAT